MAFKKIIVPLDFSKEADSALRWAFEMARRTKGGRILLVHILQPVPMMEGGFEIEPVVEALWDNARKKMALWKKKVPSGLKAETFLLIGDEAEEIARYAVRKKADLIVMPTRGRKGLSRVLNPNLSEKVARWAPCPILILPARPGARKKVRSRRPARGPRR